MFRLLKLLAYGLLGYAIYEFARGAMGQEIGQAVDRITSTGQQGRGGSRGGGGGSGQRSGIRQGNAARANMTGPGQGQVVETQDADGGSVRHAVGRGVVS